MSISSRSRLQEDTCPICEGTSHPDEYATQTLALGTTPFGVRRCSACRFRWLTPCPTSTQIESLYSQDYFEPADTPYSYEAQTQELEPCWEQRAQRFERSLEHHRILDVGCATGSFVEVAIRQGLEAFGVEPSSYAVDLAQRRGLPVMQGDLFSSGLPHDQFDGIHLSHVLEHLPDLHSSMERLSRLLIPGGLLYVEVPLQFDGVLDLYSRYIRRTVPKFSLFSVHHHYFFSLQTLQLLLERHGFEVEDSGTFLACRRAKRTPSLRKAILQSTLWMADRLVSRGDVIWAWATRSRR